MLSIYRGYREWKEKLFEKNLHNLERAITKLEIDEDWLTQRIEAIIKTIVKCLSEVKEFVLKRGFRNMDEEIRFLSV